MTTIFALQPLQLYKVSQGEQGEVQQGRNRILLNDRAIGDNVEDGEFVVIA